MKATLMLAACAAAVVLAACTATPTAPSAAQPGTLRADDVQPSGLVDTTTRGLGMYGSGG